LARLVAIEGKDHFAVKGVMIAHQAPQQSSMIITEGGPARGNRGVNSRQVGRHYVGVALDDNRLTLLTNRGASKFQPVEHMRLLVEKRFGSVDVLGRYPFVVKHPARPKPNDLAA